MGCPFLFRKRSQMIKINQNTKYFRLRRGWCKERALGVVPVPTTLLTGESLSDENFTYLSNVRRMLNRKRVHWYSATCICGKHMEISAKDLMFDAHCGCQYEGTSPTRLNWFKMCEEDKEYQEHAKKNRNVPSCAGWFTFRHF